MKVLGAVFATDGWSRDNTYMTVGALAGGLWDGCADGVPSNLSHDSLRLIGWSRPTALFMEPGIVRLTGVCCIPDTDGERRALQVRARAAQGQQYRAHLGEINELRRRLAPFTSDKAEARSCLAGCVALLEAGLATRAFPDLFALAAQDKDGLVPLSHLKPIGPGVYGSGELAVFAHTFFRRSQSRLNSLNQPFLERLQRLDDGGVPAKVALDPDLVGLASTYAPHMEFEYWWGPKFDDDLASIETGSTRHEASELDRIFYGISRTEFWWQSRKGAHIFESEELRDAPVKTEQVEGYFCRYAHSMIDEGSGQVTHFDGAVRGYSEEAMIHRLDADIKGAGRNSQYTKLWRLDSPISVSEWKSLLSDYYRDNRLVGEYLGAEPEPSPLLASGAGTARETEGETPFDLAAYVPHAMETGSGVRIALSYHESHEHPHVERRAVAIGSVEIDGRCEDIIEESVIELRKALARLDHTLAVPETRGVLHTKDLHRDFGIIAHGEAAAERPEIVHATLDGIRSLTEAWGRQGCFGTVAFSISFPIEERQARVSVIGHVVDVNHWLANPLSKMPTKRAALQAWLEEVAAFLRGAYPSTEKQSPLLEAVMPLRGSLLKRKPIENISFEQDDESIKWRMNEDELEKTPGLIEAMQSGVIVPAVCFLVERSVCQRCRLAYPTCGCCKSLDEDVVEEVVGVMGMQAVWSDRNVITAR